MQESKKFKLESVLFGLVVCFSDLLITSVALIIIVYQTPEF